MPPREPRAILEDASAQLVDLLVKVDATDLDTFLQNQDLQAIFERRFEILGEALRRLSRVDPETFERIPGSNEAVATRNLIAHGYDSVDHRLLWSVGTQFLPEMLRVIDTILAEM